MVLDNSGTVYFLGRIFNSKSKKLEKKDIPDYYFILFKTDKLSKTQKIIPVESENIIRSLHLALSANNQAAEGLYTETTSTGFFELNTGEGYGGVVRFNINPTSLLTLAESFQPFSKEFMLEKYGKVKEKIKSFLAYRNIFMLGNGDVIIKSLKCRWLTVSPSPTESIKTSSALE